MRGCSLATSITSTTTVPVVYLRFLGTLWSNLSPAVDKACGPKERRRGYLDHEVCFLLGLEGCRPKATRSKPKSAKAKKGRLDYLKPSFVADFLCFLWLSSILHAGLSVFLKEVSDVDREAFEFLVERLS